MPAKGSRDKNRSNPSESGMPTATSKNDLSTTQKPVYFYSSDNFLSNHYPITFTAPVPSFPTNPNHDPSLADATLTFSSTEQYMMYAKALLFNDSATAAEILGTSNPRKQKALGRQVAGFNDGAWAAVREQVVEQACLSKFGGGKGSSESGQVSEEVEQLKRQLLDTGNRELVEAAPRDRVWGIGYAEKDAESNRSRWGMNLLGKVLMRVRDSLRAQESRVGEEKESED